MTKDKIDILKTIHASMSNGIRSGKSNDARKWLSDKGLSIDLTGACFNSGQMHHRREKEFIEALKSVGFLRESGSMSARNINEPSYKSFGKEAIIFPLRNEQNEVVNLYAIRIQLEQQKAEYLNDEGLYPCYPAIKTQRLYLTKTILDTASLLEAKVMDNRDAVIALHDGEMKERHIQAIQSLKHLNEIIIIN